ncbi:uncharacterized protein LOC113516465 [Galleria mellonella]|uniref:Uncharacterized protein LOC113516465 n=1 Tax=Galleria mellonella TaxID=7137 RepID=A0A6J1WNJ3_GALME|nr:uncharacterized protein LOC113516465 [Galleria mellonella]
MYAIVILSILAVATAAPHYHHHHQGFNHGSSLDRYRGVEENLFDTRAFWAELENEMRQLDEMLKDFYVKFPSSVSSEGVVDNQYKIVIPLSGYQEQEIAVKAREGVLMVQAVHKYNDVSQRSYLDVRTLPESVNLTGTWTYDKDLLTIVFPLKEGAISTENPVTVLPTTDESEEHSREEMGNDNEDAQDADVGARGDKDAEILTNEISEKQAPVEATTYSVDLNNEVEFVPIHY